MQQWQSAVLLCESADVRVHCSAGDGDILLAKQLSVDRTLSETVKWPDSTAEVAALPVRC